MENHTDSQTQSAVDSTTVSDRVVAGQLDARQVTREGDLRLADAHEDEIRPEAAFEGDVQPADAYGGAAFEGDVRPAEACEGDAYEDEDARVAGTGGPESPADERAVTGEPRVDRVLRTLADIAELPLSEHPLVFERIHGQLVEVLGELRSGPDSSPPGR